MVLARLMVLAFNPCYGVSLCYGARQYYGFSSELQNVTDMVDISV